MPDFYDNKHWEELIGVIIDRIGVDKFAENVAYVLEQKGYARLGVACELLRRMASIKAEPEVEDV
jgi:dissimilatory sulfite reductase (desulfoviridin) alpha/beta subunit